MKSYSEFWSEISPAYPVSKGKIRPPIVCTPQVIDGLCTEKILERLADLLQGILDMSGGREGAVKRAVSAGEEVIVNHITEEYTGVVRFDCVVDECGGVHVLELNADYPDGLLLHDYTYQTISGTPCGLHKENLSALLYPIRNSAIHILHPKDAGFLDAYYAEYEHLRSLGHKVSIGSEVLSEDVQVIRRCTEVSKHIPEEKVENVRYINTYALRTLGYKQELVHIEHDMIPKTFDIKEVSSTMLTEKDRWVLKPSSGCEGGGVVVGCEVSDTEWEDTLSNIPSGYVAQAYVQVPKRDVLIYEDGDILKKSLYYDWSPHFFVLNGQVVDRGHILMRFSASPIVNVHKGGAIGYHVL